LFSKNKIHFKILEVICLQTSWGTTNGKFCHNENEKTQPESKHPPLKNCLIKKLVDSVSFVTIYALRYSLLIGKQHFFNKSVRTQLKMVGQSIEPGSDHYAHGY